MTYEFAVGDVVKHEATGGLYVIVQTPDRLFNLANRVRPPPPAYRYWAFKDGNEYVRNADEMEDGRFVRVDAVSAEVTAAQQPWIATMKQAAQALAGYRPILPFRCTDALTHEPIVEYKVNDEEDGLDLR